MTNDNSFQVRKYDFGPGLFNDFQNVHYAKDLWPIVYILSDGKVKEAYVGETTDTYARMSTHLNSPTKKLLSTVHLISSDKFNKSATLDIESNLIKYISGDGQYQLLNGNVGLANHNYYQKKEVYWDIFKSIWNKLRAEGITKHSIEHIDNSDLFKYSPYKSLTVEQREGLLIILKGLLSTSIKNIVVNGGAGTGKTILAVFLFKLLNTNNEDFNFKEFGDDETEFIQTVLELKKRYPAPRMALVVPMASFRKTLQKVFKNIKGLKSSMVIGPADLAKNNFDIVLVDESHRLRRRTNLGAYFGAFDIVNQRLSLDKYDSTELDWVIKQSDKAILFYDERQSVSPSDVRKNEFDKLRLLPSTKVEYLKSQFRVKGGNGYVDYIDKLLKSQLKRSDKIYNSKDYEFVLFDSIEDMLKEIKLRDAENGLSRMVAGYSWEWKSKNDKTVKDIHIGNVSLQWNSVSEDYINSPNALNEVGCIHTTQGYDLNYTGVILGNEITYNKATGEIEVLRENYFDKRGTPSKNDPSNLKDFIINIYKTIMLRGIKGTYVYVCDKNLREYFAEHIEKYATVKAVTYIDYQSVIPFVNAIPVYDLKAAAGGFSELQMIDEEDLDWIEIPARYKPSNDLFACIVVGESMNKIIPNGSVCLFRKDNGGSRNGKIVLVESSSIRDKEFGSGFTVKEYFSTKKVEDDQWEHQSIILKPRSHDSKYRDIVLSDEELTDFKVRGIFECVL
ncbi:DNA/RNA helicase domain-containing protein [Mucilaginibacter myungsuensis]|uniref:DUF2075 domain-containing protein n=1 Tax=Mucilaginibacter myungsuensis TaxID=649104 RepID=A0A929KUY1_9SPHI|nr:DNA/RNA helicase domain-containing protein [Mucilaginibacter myungsuensis]MBE9661217.1 DUF2075 domain-containing protein [Mucilaginibacter myungsuensis]MDN3597361.1 DUF2075 domain-containing protein [Mucilaginibacter myungsuensis]